MPFVLGDFLQNRGVTKQALSVESGVEYQTIQRWASGKSRQVGIEAMEQVVTALRGLLGDPSIDASDLLIVPGGKPKTPPAAKEAVSGQPLRPLPENPTLAQCIKAFVNPVELATQVKALAFGEARNESGAPVNVSPAEKAMLMKFLVEQGKFAEEGAQEEDRAVYITLQDSEGREVAKFLEGEWRTIQEFRKFDERHIRLFKGWMGDEWNFKVQLEAEAAEASAAEVKA